MRETFRLWDRERKKVIEVEAKKVGKEWKALCPKHLDKVDSLSINKEKEVYHCFGCPFSGHLYDPAKSPAKKSKKKPKKVKERKVPIDYNKIAALAKQYHQNLPQGIREILNVDRGLIGQIIQKYQVGYCLVHPEYENHKKSITIPITKAKKIVNIRYHSLDLERKKEAPKILPYQEGLDYPTWLYPEDQLENDKIIFAEGELDTLCCLSHGLNAITKTAGALTWKKEFNQFFKNKIIYICFDCDKAGKQATEKIAKELLRIARIVKIIDLGLEDKEDLTDWFIKYSKTAKELRELIDKTPVFEIKEKEGKEILERQEKKQRKEKLSKLKFNPRPYSEEILKQNSLKYDKYRRFWIYDENTNIWRDDAELILNSILRKRILGEDDYKTYCVNEIIADLQGLTFIQEEPEEPEPYLIPFDNKIYDLKNDKFLNYNPDYFFINKLAIRIDEKKQECPAINDLFTEIVEPEDLISLYEIAAYCFYRGYPYPKMFILYGSGGNGKGAYTKTLARLLGKENISLVATNDLQNNRFASSQLYRKILNVSSEMDYAILKNTSMLKKCSGEDLIYCERKFKEPFSFRNYAKIIFLTNQVPLTWDKTYAFYRRIFLLEFPRRFIEGETADPTIVEKIPKEEFEGLAWKCLEILKKLYQNNFVFSKHEKTEEVIRKYEDLSNPLNKFLEEFTEREPNSDIAVVDFNEKYISYLKEKGFRIWSAREINKAMNDKGFRQKPLRGSKDISTYRAWIELKWR